MLDLFKVEGDRREALSELLGRESVILRVMSSKQKVRVEKSQSFVAEYQIYIMYV